MFKIYTMTTEKIITPIDLLTNPPPGVDLTLVGGQAMIYWTLIYCDKYPRLFPEEAVGSTYDVDFIVKMRGSCKTCHDHWGGTLHTPAADDPTPELGVIVFNEGTDKEIHVDLLGSLIRLDRQQIEKMRNPIDPSNPLYDSMFVLTEWAVLLNRVYNTIALSRYQHEEAFVQVRNAIAIHHAYILWLLDKGDTASAQSQCNLLLNFAKTSQYGIPLYLKFNLDLLEAIPIDDKRFVEPFCSKALTPLLAEICEKRHRLRHDSERRAAQTVSKPSQKP
ncbi:MAG: hypothetical protein JKY66_00405 [Spongiibacteraceae bacterium]|nr:hypothetical protein [Spongiibacteraceae bacterium]